MELGKRDRFINKIVNSFVLIIIGESLSLYYIFASRTRVPILVRATILVTILQWPIILFARPGLFYSTCPTITVYLTMTDLLHCRSITVFISPYPPLPGIMKTKIRLLLYPCRLNFIQRCLVDSTFLFTNIRFDSIRLEGSVLTRSPLLPREVELREEETLHVQSTFLIRCRRKKGRNGTEGSNLLRDRRAFSSIPVVALSAVAPLYKSSFDPLPFRRLAYPVTHKSELLSVSKGMQGRRGERRGDGIVFCAVRSILRRRRHSASRTCMCTRIIGNVLGGVLDSPRSNVRVYVGNLSPKLLSVPSSCKNCKIRAALRVYYRSDHFWIKWKRRNSKSMSNIGGLCSKTRVYLGIVFLDMKASLYSSIV